MTDNARLAREKWMRQIVEETESDLVRYAFTLTRDLSLARDVVQDAFLRLWQSDDTEIRGHEKPWLFLVCRNRALDILRKEIRLLPTDLAAAQEPQDAATPPDCAVVNKETNLALMKMVDSLPENQREVIRLKFQNGLSYQEIGQITRLSVNHVGVLLHTAVKNLRQKWLAAERQIQTI
jgi:RNA polymerase sigma-70 factor (ECF subfamily)